MHVEFRTSLNIAIQIPVLCSNLVKEGRLYSKKSERAIGQKKIVVLNLIILVFSYNFLNKNEDYIYSMKSIAVFERWTDGQTDG